MNAAHVHLMLNHVSIIGSLFGLVLLAVAMMRHSSELVTVWHCQDVGGLV